MARPGTLRAVALLLFAAVGITAGITLSGHRASAVTPSTVTITGVDAHDGTIRKDGSTYIFYGTRYACGFNWGVNGTPFCGFGVYTAPSLSGPWTSAGTLFDPAGTDTTSARTWQSVCGTGGRGCFNPRMIQRADGVWILWFNAPSIYVAGGISGSYYVMGCNGPTGPCGTAAGLPHGSTHRPYLYFCNGADGDFSILEDGAAAAIVCTSGQSLRVEALDQWWANGSTSGASTLAGLTATEGPGIVKNTDGTYVVTYSDPYCGYCSGVATGYMVSTGGLAGPWQTPPNVTAGGPLPTQRRDFLASSCGGQPRTIVRVDDNVYQLIDNWYGSTNETNASTTLVQLAISAPYLQAANGLPFHSGVTGTC